jgi:hypothetical protein
MKRMMRRRKRERMLGEEAEVEERRLLAGWRMYGSK